MIGRIVRPADFERVLSAPQRSRSIHFAIHYVSGGPQACRAAAKSISEVKVIPGLSSELSTSGDAVVDAVVDDSGRWLGLVVPKRHAKRAVTRNLIKRQVRAAMARHADALPAGMWVVRLRAPFDRQAFQSPASAVLRDVAREEVDDLFLRAIHAPLAPKGGGRGRPAVTRPQSG
jgi:ribonuclease P protein component